MNESRSEVFPNSALLSKSPSVMPLDNHGRTRQQCEEMGVVFVAYPPLPMPPLPVPIGSRIAAWVIVWRYYDRSAHGVVRAYLKRERAEEDLALLKSDCTSDRAFEIQEMELYE